MGIFDFFKGKNNEPDKDAIEHEEVRNLVMTYSSGIVATVQFKDVTEYMGKHIQLATVWYADSEKEDARSIGKDFLLEPHIGQDDRGNAIYDTEAYYKSLCENGKRGAVKGFFQKEQVDKRETNYLGVLEFDQEGRASRKEDKAFLEQYKGVYKEQKESSRQQKIDIKNRTDEFQEKLSKQAIQVSDDPENYVEVLHLEPMNEREHNNRFENNKGMER